MPIPKVFYSFHFDNDHWRTGQVRNIGTIEGSKPAHDNDWEAIKRGGDAAIQRWIDEQLKYRQCTIVLIGSETHGRKWINYEIKKSWDDGKGLLGIHIHGLKDRFGYQASKGRNPFEYFNVGGMSMSQIVPVYDPPSWDSKGVYGHIADNIGNWVDHAIRVRNSY